MGGKIDVVRGKRGQATKYYLYQVNYLNQVTNSFGPYDTRKEAQDKAKYLGLTLRK